MQDLRKVRTCVKAALRNLPDHPVNCATWLDRAEEILDELIENDPYVIIIEKGGINEISALRQTSLSPIRLRPFLFARFFMNDNVGRIPKASF
jgi:DNA-binding NarL/FixJ family response regulator